MIHILVLDDDAMLCKTVCTYLNDSGFKAEGVKSPVWMPAINSRTSR